MANSWPPMWCRRMLLGSQAEQLKGSGLRVLGLRALGLGFRVDFRGEADMDGSALFERAQVLVVEQVDSLMVAFRAPLPATSSVRSR